MMQSKIRKILKYLISISLAAVLLWFSFREVEWAAFARELSNCRWGFIIISMLLGAFAFWVRGLRWRQLLMPIDPSISRMTTFNGINVGNISNFVFPRIGEFVRCGVITRRSSVTYEKVLGTVVLERSWELLVMLLMLALVVAAGFERFGVFFVEQIWTPISQRLDVSLWWVIAVLMVMGLAGVWGIWRLRKSNSICSKIWNIFSGLIQGFSSCLRMERKWMFFAYTLFIWMIYWLMAATTVWAAPFLDHLTMVDALFLSLVGGLGFAVPVPGGIGAFHFIISLALMGVYDVPMETGIVYATLSHTSQAVTQIIFGLISYTYEAIRK